MKSELFHFRGWARPAKIKNWIGSIFTKAKGKSWTPTFICRNIVVDFFIMAQYRYSLEAVVVRTHAADETGRSMLWREWGVLMFFWKWLWKKNIFRRIWRTSPRIMNWKIKVKARNCLPGKQNYTYNFKNFVKNDLY